MQLGLTILGLAATAALSEPSPHNARIATDRRFRSKTPAGINITAFQQVSTESSIEYVTNSGICETTPGVNQYSGYLSVGTNMSMWFWFFEARDDPANAPVTVWLNGGPGCSSMMGLFQENGPCHFVNNQTEPSLNPHSWNNYANMLYIDQPVGAGFSYGNREVNSTVNAAPYVWKFMQTFFTNFPQYKTREFGLFTESYGGHYGPETANYFIEQNDKIGTGHIQGQRIELIALGINNGWIDPTPQNKAYVTYAFDNPYRKLINETVLERLLEQYNTSCLPALERCPDVIGNDSDCAVATVLCEAYMENGVQLRASIDFNVYDLRVGSAVVDPPDTYMKYITREDVARAIGAHSTFSDCDSSLYNSFQDTGDNARSFLGRLSSVVQRNITTLIWAGDADWICNWEGNLQAADAIDWGRQTEFASASVRNYTVDGAVRGTFKTLDNLSWFRVFEAGHMVPYYQPEAALQVFVQTMKREPLSST